MDGEFPSNSQRARRPAEKPEPKKIEKIVQGNVTQRKRPLSRRISEVFVGGDARSVGSFVALEVMVPALKDMIADTFSQAIERMIFGESRSTSRRTGRMPGSNHISYNRFSQGMGSRPREEPQRELSRRGRSSHNFNEIVLETRVEAEEVIDQLFECVSRYESASVADLYDMLGVEQSFTDEKWGWRDLRGAGVTRVRGGYLLDLPRPEPID